MRVFLTRGFVMLALIGLASAWLLGQTAHAHANTVTAVTSCVVDGQIHVVWSIVNDDSHSETATYSGAVSGVTTIDPFGTATVAHDVPASAAGTTISLHVEAVWSDGFEGSADGSVTLPGDCPVPPETPPGVPVEVPVAVIATPQTTG